MTSTLSVWPELEEPEVTSVSGELDSTTDYSADSLDDLSDRDEEGHAKVTVYRDPSKRQQYATIRRRIDQLHEKVTKELASRNTSSVGFSPKSGPKSSAVMLIGGNDESADDELDEHFKFLDEFGDSSRSSVIVNKVDVRSVFAPVIGDQTDGLTQSTGLSSEVSLFVKKKKEIPPVLDAVLDAGIFSGYRSEFIVIRLRKKRHLKKNPWNE